VTAFESGSEHARHLAYSGEVTVESKTKHRPIRDAMAQAEAKGCREQEREVFDQKRIHVLFPSKHWTPVRRDVFEHVLKQLAGALIQGFYLLLYDHAWHSRNNVIEATVSDFAAWTGADPRTLQASVERLCHDKLIARVSRGHSKSRTRKPRWRVPLAEFALSDTGTPWTPVPRFFITEYFRCYHPSLILSILQRYQHINWRNDCWVGMKRLCELTGWKRRTVYDALHTLGHENEWKRVSQNLPRPLEISQTSDQQTRHFRVLALSYEQKGRNKRSTVSLTPKFAKHFDVRSRQQSVDADFSEETSSDGHADD
jgi:hypothetical protein